MFQFLVRLPVGSSLYLTGMASKVDGGFRLDPNGHIETLVQKLLEDPITYVEALLRTLGPAELNGKGKGLSKKP